MTEIKSKEIDIEKNKILDEIIINRRTIREFKTDKPPKEFIEEILKAGLYAPFASIAVTGEKFFRKFYILEQGESADKFAKIVQKKVIIIADNISSQINVIPKAAEFLKILKDIADNGFKIESPYTIIIAEKEGFPPVAQLSLAHCLENMWLKTTALGLGFRLLSIISELSKNDEFCQFININPGEYALNGCAIGYIKTVPPNVERPLLSEVTTWIS